MPSISSHVDQSRNSFADAVALWALQGQRSRRTLAVLYKHPDQKMYDLYRAIDIKVGRPP